MCSLGGIRALLWKCCVDAIADEHLGSVILRSTMTIPPFSVWFAASSFSFFAATINIRTKLFYLKNRLFLCAFRLPTEEWPMEEQSSKLDFHLKKEKSNKPFLNFGNIILFSLSSGPLDMGRGCPLKWWQIVFDLIIVTTTLDGNIKLKHIFIFHSRCSCVRIDKLISLMVFKNCETKTDGIIDFFSSLE